MFYEYRTRSDVIRLRGFSLLQFIIVKCNVYFVVSFIDLQFSNKFFSEWFIAFVNLFFIWIHYCCLFRSASFDADCRSVRCVAFSFDIDARSRERAPYIGKNIIIRTFIRCEWIIFICGAVIDGTVWVLLLHLLSAVICSTSYWFRMHIQTAAIDTHFPVAFQLATINMRARAPAVCWQLLALFHRSSNN